MRLEVTQKNNLMSAVELFFKKKRNIAFCRDFDLLRKRAAIKHALLGTVDEDKYLSIVNNARKLGMRLSYLLDRELPFMYHSRFMLNKNEDNRLLFEVHFFPQMSRNFREEYKFCEERNFGDKSRIISRLVMNFEIIVLEKVATVTNVFFDEEAAA